MKTNEQELQLKQSGYIGLQLAQNQVHKVLRRLMGNTPIQYNLHSSENESVMVFIGNGICATLHVQSINSKQKGGELCVL